VPEPTPQRTTVYVVPPPTSNGPLHLGHLSGPYLASDIAARAGRQRGERVLELGGVDVHQNYVLTRAQNEGLDVDAMVSDYRGRIADAYRLAGIRPDASVDPQDLEHQRLVAGLVEDLVVDGTLRMADRTLHACSDCGRTLHHSYVVGTCSRCGSRASGGSCEGCGGFTSAQDLLDPRCDRCGGDPRAFLATIPVLRLEEFRDQLVAVLLGAQLGPRARALVTGYLAGPLPEVAVAYPTDWGCRGSGLLDGLRVDVYVEVVLGTVLTVARTLDPEARGLDDLRRSWHGVEELWHFNGIDNAFYFALLWPVLYLACGATPDQLPGTVDNEFYTLDGEKFSTSRDHAIWTDDLLASGEADHAELVRLFLAWSRPAPAPTDFTLASFEAFTTWARPLLAGHHGTVPDGLSAAEVERGQQALHPRSFDPSLAVRCLFTALATGGDHRAVALRRALGGGE
jgi:methionyl-tRNA synthetase